MTYRLTETGIDETIRALRPALRPAIEAGALGIAAAVQDVLSPYPPAPPRRSGRSYYVRGKGLYSSSGRLLQASETLNRKWTVRGVTLGARLRNTASYSGLVHGRKKQTKRHARTGWQREDIAVQEVRNSGEARRIMIAAISAALKGRRP